VDVFITEGQMDAMTIQQYKFGVPLPLLQIVIDSYHTPFYAAGWLMNEIQPRVGVVTHFEEPPTDEGIAEIRAHWPGLFIYGAPDVKVINVTKDAIWERMALRPEHASISPPNFADLFPAGQMPDKFPIPVPKLPREQQQEQFLRDMEIPKEKYYPADVARELVQHYTPEAFTLDLQAMMEVMQRGK